MEIEYCANLKKILSLNLNLSMGNSMVAKPGYELKFISGFRIS